MGLEQLTRRVALLEFRQRATVPEAVAMVDTEITPEYVAEVLRLLWQYGLFASVEDMLMQTFALRDLDPAMVAEVAMIVTVQPGEIWC